MKGESVSDDSIIYVSDSSAYSNSTHSSVHSSAEYAAQLSECEESINSEFDTTHSNSHSTITGADSTAESTAESTSSNITECIICCDAPVDIVLAPCAHSVTCAKCADRIETCPICRCILVKPEAPETNCSAITQDAAVVASLFMLINITIGVANVQFFGVSLHDSLILSGVFSFIICVLTIAGWLKQLKNNQTQRAVDNYTVV